MGKNIILLINFKRNKNIFWIVFLAKGSHIQRLIQSFEEQKFR